MEISPAVASELALLSQALADSPDDLAGRVRTFAATIELAVPSYLGLTLRLREDPAVYLTSMTETGDTALPAGTSLLIPGFHLDPAHDPTSANHVTLVLYAARPGAFVDLAADLALLTGTDLHDVVLDRHLPPPPRAAPMLERESTINQAIGVLIGSGRTPHEAWTELKARALVDQTDPWSVSARLLDDLGRRKPPVPGTRPSGSS